MAGGPFKDEAGAQSWLLDQWNTHFAAAVGAMTKHTVTTGGAGGETPGPLRWYRQDLSLAGAFLLVGAGEQDWLRLGAAALKGAGLAGVSDEEAFNTCLELLAKATSGLADAIGREIGGEVTVQPPQAVDPVPAALAAAGYAFDLGPDGPITLFVAPGPELCAALMLPQPVAPLSLPAASTPVSRTLDLLLEVELPVSISFGRANLPLREVLKLNSGSIVELNRTISEPVEVIVNNCVIARGEVVVVDGNYGIRIQHVISREERLRSLN